MARLLETGWPFMSLSVQLLFMLIALNRYLEKPQRDESDPMSCLSK